MDDMRRRREAPFDPGQVVCFKALSPSWHATPPNSDGPKRVREVRWVNTACESGWLIDVQDENGSSPRWTGYDSNYFEARE